MKKRSSFFIHGAIAVCFALTLCSCSNIILEEIKKDIEDAKHGGRPVINVFQLTSSNPTNNNKILFQLSGSADVTGWFVNESKSQPDANSSKWASKPPTQFILSAGEGSRTIYAWAKNSGDVLSDSKSITVTLDTIAPVINTFDLTSPSPTSSNVVTFTLDGSDGTGSGINGWLVKEGSATPSPSEGNWQPTAPTTCTISSGSGEKTIYAWIRDKAQNISASQFITVTYNDMGDTPDIDVFTRTSPAVTNDTEVTFSLSGNAYVTNWLINESSSVPDPNGAGWSADETPPSTYILTGGDGPYTIYAWAKNAYDVVSTSKNISVTLDTEAPVINTFSLTSGSPTSSRTISFTLEPDDSGWVWLINETSTAPDPNSGSWLSSKPSGYYVNSGGDGLKTVYAWAMDMAKNVSLSKTLTVYIHETVVTGTIQGDISLMVGHQSIEIEFSEPMDTGTLSVTGDFSAGDASWDVANDTLTWTPTTVWSAGTGKTLTVNCECTHGMAMGTITEIGIEVFHGVCVDDDNGAHLNPGTPLEPIDTIQEGIEKADELYDQDSDTVEVRVAAGIYESDELSKTDDDGVPLIEMVDKISILGGFSESNWAVQNYSANVTYIIDASLAGGTSEGNPNRAIYCAAGIDNSTLIQGFTIKIGKGVYNTAIFCEDGSPSIQNNIIIGRDKIASTANSYGILISGNGVSPSIEDNTIFDDWEESDANYSYGIYFFTSSSPTIQSNTIYGGRAINNAYGVYVGSAGSTIDDNDIFGGWAANAGITYGIFCDWITSAAITNNRIDCTDNINISEAYCIYLQQSQPSINSNTLSDISQATTKAYAIYEDHINSDPSSVQKNDFDGFFTSAGTTGYYWDENIARVADLDTTTVDNGGGAQTLDFWSNYSDFNSGP